MNVAEKIYEHVRTLPAPTAQEVLDFVEFVESKLSLTNKPSDAQRIAGKGWPDVILAFEGVPDMSPFEQDRALLKPPAEDPLA